MLTLYVPDSRAHPCYVSSSILKPGDTKIDKIEYLPSRSLQTEGEVEHRDADYFTVRLQGKLLQE